MIYICRLNYEHTRYTLLLAVDTSYDTYVRTWISDHGRAKVYPTPVGHACIHACIIRYAWYQVCVIMSCRHQETPPPPHVNNPNIVLIR